MIYFVTRKSDGAIKVGVSKNPKIRISGLKATSREPVFLLGICEGSYGAEKAFHLLLQNDRLDGEWFKDSPFLRSIIKRIHAMERGINTPPEVIEKVRKPYVRKSAHVPTGRSRGRPSTNFDKKAYDRQRAALIRAGKWQKKNSNKND